MSNRDDLIAWVKGNPDMLVALVDTGTEQRWTIVRSVASYLSVFPDHKILETIHGSA